jgi:hypothetical protein
MVPTTISESAVEILNQIESRLARRASPSHKAASAQMPVMTLSVVKERGGRKGSEVWSVSGDDGS